MPRHVMNVQARSTRLNFDGGFPGEKPVNFEWFKSQGADCLFEQSFEGDVRVWTRVRQNRAIVGSFQGRHIDDMVVMKVGEEEKIDPVFT